MQEFLWYNCSAVCGSSAQQLYDGVNGDLLQEGLCHRLCDPGGCTQSPYLCSRPLLTHISHASKVMLKILQARLQQYVNRELPDVQAGFRKGRGTRDQIVIISWITEKARKFQKNIYFCFIDYGKAFDCVDHNKLWKILQEMGILYHLTCCLRTLYAGQEATVRTGHGKTDWFQIGKGVCQGCILSPCLFNVYAGFSSVIQSCPTLCNPMNCSTPGLFVHHHLPEFTQTHVH